jgi:Tol biopolymer transport system component
MTSGAVLCAALLVYPVSARGQGTDADRQNAARAERVAREFEAAARVLTVFDRQGKVVTTVGQRGVYFDPVFSPDRTRLAVIQADFEAETRDVWVFDVATGRRTRITSNRTVAEERVRSPIWSPDGLQLAYAALRDGYEGVYRAAADGMGAEELLYRHPGANLSVEDWSLDGRYLSFSTSDVFGSALYVLPVAGDGAHIPIEVVRGEFELRGGVFSPDGRFVSYGSDESGSNEVYVRPLSLSSAPVAGPPQAVSDNRGRFTMHSGWRRDGREFYYVAQNLAIMAVEVMADSTIELGRPTLLFRPSQAIPLDPRRISVSRDGERIVIAVPHAPKLEQVTVFDRQGAVLQRLGEPGVYRNPTLSPDGRRIAVTKAVPETGDWDIWMFNLTSGVDTPVTSDASEDDWPIWSPDGSELAYRSQRGLFERIYRKRWDGTGIEERVFQYTPGAHLEVTDWSADGRFLTFQDGCWGVLYVVPLAGAQDAPERRAMEWLRDEYQVAEARFSPDVRLIAYLSDQVEADEFRLYVSPFDPTRSDAGRGSAMPVQVVSDNILGMVSWRQDGRELYYLTPDWEVMAVDITTMPTIQAGTPRRLFTLPGPLPGNPKQWKSVAPDGQRFVFVLNVPVTVP